MAKLPPAPTAAALAKIPPVVRDLPAGTTLWRIYFQGGKHPSDWDTFRRYGPVDQRFDHHLPPSRAQKRAILYAAADSLYTCFAEVFQRTRVINTTRESPWLVGFVTTQPLKLLDLMSEWSTQAGASMLINSGSKKRARDWSRAIYRAYPSVGGLWYGSSMDANRPAIALYERGASAMPANPVFHRSLADPIFLGIVLDAARRFNYDVC